MNTWERMQMMGQVAQDNGQATSADLESITKPGETVASLLGVEEAPAPGPGEGPLRFSGQWVRLPDGTLKFMKTKQWRE